MQVTILGNGAGGPFQGRHYTAQLLQVQHTVYLIDCGEGTQHQLYHHRVRHDHLEQIFISHLHGDHVFGLIGLLTSFCLKKRTAPLHLFGPEGLRGLIETTSAFAGVRYPYELVFHEVDTTVVRQVFENELITVSTIPLDHRTLCTGWLFREKMRPRNMRPDKIEEYGIPFQVILGIKAGNDLVLPDGSTVPNAELTLDPPRPRSYAFCSDTAPSEAVVAAVQGVNLLYHEATFTDEHLEEAAIAYHSTAAQAADVARRAGVGQLLLGHFSARYKDLARHLAEAQVVFGNTLLAEEGAELIVDC
jgi:ribonuclease Z